MAANWYLEDAFYTMDVPSPREQLPVCLDEEPQKPTPEVPIPTRYGVGTNHLRAYTKVPTEPTQSHTDPIQIPLKVVSPPIVTPSPPFYVKAIPDNIEQESFVFKYGVLAKWHVIDELANTSPHPPSYTESQEVIQLCEYGGEGAKREHPKAKEDYPEAKKSHVKRRRRAYKRSTNGMCFNRCKPTRTRFDEWVEDWDIHSGRFKLLT